MTKQEYANFCESHAEFMRREGITNLSSIDGQGFFSNRPCECCGDIAGDREEAHGWNPTTKEVCGPYWVCFDCLYYAAYGDLGDYETPEPNDPN